MADTVAIRRNETLSFTGLAELGIFGIFLADDEAVLSNCYGGYLLRVKPSEFDEGGVAAGYSFLSAPSLF